MPRHIRSQALWSIRDYITNTGGGPDGLHAPLAGWFWWSWNPNSGDTGGLVRLIPPLCHVFSLTTARKKGGELYRYVQECIQE